MVCRINGRTKNDFWVLKYNQMVFYMVDRKRGKALWFLDVPEKDGVVFQCLGSR